MKLNSTGFKTETKTTILTLGVVLAKCGKRVPSAEMNPDSRVSESSTQWGALAYIEP